MYSALNSTQSNSDVHFEPLRKKNQRQLWIVGLQILKVLRCKDKQRMLNINGIANYYIVISVYDYSTLYTVYSTHVWEKMQWVSGLTCDPLTTPP